MIIVDSLRILQSGGRREIRFFGFGLYFFGFSVNKAKFFGFSVFGHVFGVGELVFFVRVFGDERSIFWFFGEEKLYFKA